METTLYNKDGEAIAYITEDYHETIYLWDGSPVAYLHDEQHVYGINGHHLGWFINNILFTNKGERVGFTAGSCPVTIAKEPVKAEKHARDEIRSRWKAPALPKLEFILADQNLEDFLREGQVVRFREEESSEEVDEG